MESQSSFFDQQTEIKLSSEKNESDMEMGNSESNSCVISSSLSLKERSSPTSATLRNLIFAREKEKPFKCELCQKSYKHKSELSN